MTQEELEVAVNRLIAEANADSEEAKKKYDAAVLDAKFTALENRMWRSDMLEEQLASLEAEYESVVLRIQTELDKSLDALYAENEQGGGGTPPSGADEAPYEVDYSLSMRDRYVVVKNYYLSLPDKAQALAACQADTVAADYLGDYYDYLIQLLVMIQ